MKRNVRRPMPFALTILALSPLLCTACTGLQTPAHETLTGIVESAAAQSMGSTSQANLAADAPTGDTASGAVPTAAPDSSPALTNTELQLLQDVLGRIGSGTASGLSTVTSGTPSLANLKSLGFSRREIAIWTLDVVAQQGNLTADQTFAVKLLRALLAHDSGTVEQLLIGQLLQNAASITGTATNS